MTNTPSALSVEEFCKTFDISKSMFYKLRKLGKAPRTLTIGRRRVITTDAMQEWQSNMEDVS